jgi:hypothetical protein
MLSVISTTEGWIAARAARTLLVVAVVVDAPVDPRAVELTAGDALAAEAPLADSAYVAAPPSPAASASRAKRVLAR